LQRRFSMVRGASIDAGGEVLKLAFIGLGVMGFPMAGHLRAGGYDVCVYNRTAEKAERWRGRHGGRTARTPGEAAHDADIVCMCVGNDEDVRSVVYGSEGILTAMSAGAVLVDHTTASDALARELEGAVVERRGGFIDAPVSGGQAGAERGALTIMAGGEPETFARVEPVLGCYAQCVRLLGPAGSGQLAKMVNQICIAGVIQGLAEGLAFAERAGLDAAAVVEVISRGAAQSWQMDNRYRSMLAGEYDHGFAVDWMRKDLKMALTRASQMGLDLPLTQMVDGFYAEVQAMGGARWDTSSLLARMRAMHGED